MNPQEQPKNAQPAAPAAAPAGGSQKTNTMAIIALVLAFIFPLIGLILAIVAKSQIKKTGEGGDGLATAALILSIIFLVLEFIWLVFVLIAVLGAASTSTYTTSFLGALVG